MFGLDQGKQILRLTHLQMHAVLQIIECRLRAAARSRVFQNAQAEHTFVARVLADGILSYQTIGQMHIDVRTRFDFRQTGCIDGFKFQHRHILPLYVAFFHHHIVKPGHGCFSSIVIFNVDF